MSKPCPFKHLRHRSRGWACLGLEAKFGNVQAQPAQPSTRYEHARRRRSLLCQPVLLPHAHTPTCQIHPLPDKSTTYSGALISLSSSHVTTLCALGGPHNCNSADGKFMPVPVTPPTEIKNQEVARPGIALCGLPCTGCTGVMPCGRTRKHSLSSATMRL